MYDLYLKITLYVLYARATLNGLYMRVTVCMLYVLQGMTHCVCVHEDHIVCCVYCDCHIVWVGWLNGE